jgi:hypothetical protein
LPKVAEAGAMERAELEAERGEGGAVERSQTNLTKIGLVTRHVVDVAKSVTSPSSVLTIFQQRAKRRVLTMIALEALNPAVARLGQIRKRYVRSSLN